MHTKIFVYLYIYNLIKWGFMNKSNIKKLAVKDAADRIADLSLELVK